MKCWVYGNLQQLQHICQLETRGFDVRRKFRGGPWFLADKSWPHRNGLAKHVAEPGLMGMNLVKQV